MAWIPLTEEDARREIGVSKRTMEKYRRRGADGFQMTGNQLFFDPMLVEAWREENLDHRSPGQKRKRKKKAAAAKRAASKAAPAKKAEGADGGEAPLLDPELEAALAEAERAAKDGAPLESELSRCRLLFDRFSRLVLCWNEKRLLDPGDQKRFCDVAKVFNQLTAKITAAEGKLIEVRRRHGELVPIDDVRAMLRSLADDVVRGSDELVGPLAARMQAYFEEAYPDAQVDGDQLRRLAAEEVKRWRNDLAERHRAGPVEAAA